MSSYNNNQNLNNCIR